MAGYDTSDSTQRHSHPSVAPSLPSLPASPPSSITCPLSTLVGLASGHLSPSTAFLTGAFRVSGDIKKVLAGLGKQGGKGCRREGEREGAQSVVSLRVLSVRWRLPGG